MANIVGTTNAVFKTRADFDIALSVCGITSDTSTSCWVGLTYDPTTCDYSFADETVLDTSSSVFRFSSSRHLISKININVNGIPTVSNGCESLSPCVIIDGSFGTTGVISHVPCDAEAKSIYNVHSRESTARIMDEFGEVTSGHGGFLQLLGEEGWRYVHFSQA